MVYGMIGMPGPFEMLIILAIGAFVFGVPLLLLYLLLTNGKPAKPQGGPPCPGCGGWTVPQANYCQWCGKALGTSAGAT